MKHRFISVIFGFTLLILIGLFIGSIIGTYYSNLNIYELELTGSDLFTSTPDKSKEVSLNINIRDGSWGKVFDLNNEGITENNYTAHTYDITIDNYTSYEVKEFSFKLLFKHEAFISQAWNGMLEIHQFVNGIEHIELIDDLRTYNPLDYDLNYFLDLLIFVHYLLYKYLNYFLNNI